MPVDQVASAVNEWCERRDTIDLFHDYYAGRHSYGFASVKFLEKYRWVIEQARENLCPAVVAAFVDRLAIQSWGTSAQLDEATEQGLSRLQNLVHTEAYQAGNAFVLTWYRPGSKDPLPIFQRADQGVPEVDEHQPDRLKWYTKLWVDPDTGYGRANVYDDEKLTRWVTQQKITVSRRKKHGRRVRGWTLPESRAAWEPYDTEDAPREEPHDFKATPAVWWKRAAPDQFDWGVSILRDAIPVQDELNKLIADEIVASERIALPIRYIMQMAEQQLQAKLNPKTGKMEPPKLPFDETVNSILALTGKGPAGEFPGPDADKLVALQEHAEQKMARVTGVPSFYLSQSSGDVPSGDSLRVLSSRLTSGVSTFQQDAAPSWRGQMALLGYPDASPVWESPVPMDEMEKLQAAQAKKDLGYPLVDIFRDLGEQDAERLAQDAKAQENEAAVRAGNVLTQGFGL